jgi:hypothetical protein
MKRFLNGIEKEPKIDDLAVEYDLDEFVEAFKDYDQSVAKNFMIGV